jgi:hypothetical protein
MGRRQIKVGASTLEVPASRTSTAFLDDGADARVKQYESSRTTKSLQVSTRHPFPYHFSAT